MVNEQEDLSFIAELLGVRGDLLHTCLCNRKVARSGSGPRGSSYLVPLTKEEASYGRDALAKALYSR